MLFSGQTGAGTPPWAAAEDAQVVKTNVTHAPPRLAARVGLHAVLRVEDKFRIVGTIG